jgi:superfamily I DNA and RNA helicase
MEFHPQEPFDSNAAQKHVWSSLKQALQEEPGVAYYRYPIFAKGGRRHREPDFLLLHPELGLWTIECKGCRIDNVAAIQGHEWVMRDWHEEVETPVAQAEDQMYAVKSRFDDRRETRGLVACGFRVALPYVTRAEWRERGFDELTGDVVLLREDLFPGSVLETLRRCAEEYPQKPLTPEQWELAAAVLRGELPRPAPRPVPTGTPAESPVRVIRAIEDGLKALDDEQHKAAFQIPGGPQRLRGLAGTGKTVLFAKRAAKIHARHPDWRIALVFFTKSLYDHTRGLVAAYYREMTGEAPDWRKVEVLHAWGNQRQPGFYSNLARACGRQPTRHEEARRKTGSRNPDELFRYLCDELDGFASQVPELYDAVLIDEGQDLPPSFYRLALRSLKEPKRLFWAYDEAQGIGSLTVPRPAVVFGEKDGKPLVDLAGNYEGGIEKSHVFWRCYRTPELLLMAAHAVNMGLLRKGGPLQGLTRQEEWRQLGYEVEGSFVKAGELVRLQRSADARMHPVDRDPGLAGKAGPLLRLHTFADERAECQWIARQVADDIKAGLRPADVLITALTGEEEQDYFGCLRSALEAAGVKVWVPGSEMNSTDFRREGCVTLATIFQAKGNEAWKVYAARFHYATVPVRWRQEDELHKRNQAFVALTRARLWCVATGVEGPIFEELRRAIEQAPELAFPAFNRRSLRRVTDEVLVDEEVAVG